MKAITQEMLKIYIRDMIINLRLHPHLPGANVLRHVPECVGPVPGVAWPCLGPEMSFPLADDIGIENDR